MYNKILVPLDGSEFGECSLEHVRAMARAEKGAKIVLLYVLEHREEGYMRAWVSPEIITEAEERGRKYAEDYLGKVATKLSDCGAQIEKVIKDGFAADVILQYAKDEGVDLIVMSTHGRSGIAKWALGGVADSVVRHSTAPLLLVAPKACRLG
jgi:nucleotide-binding universal stress UspA family protein